MKKNKLKKKDKKIINRIILSNLLLFLIVTSIIVVVEINLPNSSESVVKQIDYINVEDIIKDYKNKYVSLVYESKNISDFVSLVFNESNNFKEFIIDKKSGKELDINSLFEMAGVSEIENKLLNLKYPEFIIEGIRSSNGEKFYFIKDNELIIYYNNYVYSEIINEVISLTINYNEIKDYLKFTPVFDDAYTNEDGFNYIANKKAVALTIDDGPDRKNNPLILNILKKNKAHATFFMVGNLMSSCQNCVLNTYNSGNEIGTHTYEHINIKKSKKEDVIKSLDKTNNIYNTITNDFIKYLRPPYGAYNTTNLEYIDYPFILWNLDTEDWRYRDKDHIVNYIKENISDGSIILVHELYATTVEALEEVLPWLYANNYQIVSISELVNLKGITIQNHNTYKVMKNNY